MSTQNFTADPPRAEFGRAEAKGNGVIGVAPIVFAALLFGGFMMLAPSVAEDRALIWTVGWIPSLDIQFSFLVDGLSLAFALLISGIGALVLLYSNTYMDGQQQYGRFALL